MTQINGRTKHIIYKESELPLVPIRLIKVRFVRTIARFNNNANNPSVQFISKINCLKDQLGV